MAIHGNTWQYMVIHGDTWKYMDIYGNTWQYMVIHGITWLYMGIHGNTTTTIKLYLRYHFIKNALPVSRLHNKILRETTLMLKYIYILRKSIL